MEINLIVLFGVVLVAVIVQYIVEAIKVPIVQICAYRGIEDKYTSLLAPFLSLFCGVALCILIKCDLFVAFGYALSVPLIGNIASGIIASLGANKVYSLISDLKDYKNKLAIEKEKNIEV